MIVTDLLAVVAIMVGVPLLVAAGVVWIVGRSIDAQSNRRRALDMASRVNYGLGQAEMLARAKEIEAYLNGRGGK